MPEPAPPPREFAPFRTLPGRLFLLSSALLLLVLTLQRLVTLPDIVDVFRKVDVMAWLLSIAWLIGLGVARNWGAFLWRVRRKLILSYVFLGVVPVVLISFFALVGGFLLYINVASYVFQEGYEDLVENVRQFADTSAGEIARSPATTRSAIERKVTNLAARYPALSMTVVDVVAEGAPANAPVRDAESVRAGPWRHGPAPTSLPAWVARARGYTGTLVFSAPGNADEPHLLIRSVVLTPDGTRAVITDLPLDTDLIAQLHDSTGTRIDEMTPTAACAEVTAPAPVVTNGRLRTIFRQTSIFMDCADWRSGQRGVVAIKLDAPVGRLYDRLASAQSGQIARLTGASFNVFLVLLVLLASLLLIVQGSALVLGGMLARQITSAVHELFVGTERVRQGDFAHRIKIESRDQLGELSDSFNRMSSSIEHLLHVQREKQRLDDELRIAREIQKSLLPVHPPKIAGLDIADLCEPAREVGGDYYDFFEVGPRQLGVLIADVSGKGTSAALYMAELKGLMLALSHTERSPRRLLVDVNRRLADQLDNRSFITMTYAIIDLEARTLTCARAGHTPLIMVSSGQSQVIIPNGMVLGLRLPGASDRFESLLEEHTQRLATGDVIVLYTDGITEAMDPAGELFGDEALAGVLQSHHRLDAAGLRERVLRDVRAFVGDAEAHDDMTMIIMKLTLDAA